MASNLALFSPLFMIVAIALLGSRRRLVRSFERADATTPAAAFLPPTRLLTRWWLHRLHRCGVLQATDDGAYWLRLEAWQRYRDARRRRGLLIFAVLGAIVVLGAVLRG